MKHRAVLIFMLFFVCVSCISSDLLKNGYTKVPRDNAFFNNPKFSPDVFKVVDTNSVYIETHSFFKGMKQLPDRYVSVFRFYSNGLYNRFTFSKESIILNDLGSNSLDFRENGTRGYYYSERGKLELISYGPTNELYTMGTNRWEMVLTKDGLLKVTLHNEEELSHYHEKIPLPEKWKDVKPDKNWK